MLVTADCQSSSGGQERRKPVAHMLSPGMGLGAWWYRETESQEGGSWMEHKATAHTRKRTSRAPVSLSRSGQSHLISRAAMGKVRDGPGSCSALRVCNPRKGDLQDTKAQAAERGQGHIHLKAAPG